MTLINNEPLKKRFSHSIFSEQHCVCIVSNQVIIFLTFLPLQHCLYKTPEVLISKNKAISLSVELRTCTRYSDEVLVHQILSQLKDIHPSINVQSLRVNISVFLACCCVKQDAAFLSLPAFRKTSGSTTAKPVVYDISRETG